MKASRFTEEQIVRALQEVETGQKKAAEQQRDLAISAATWYICKQKEAWKSMRPSISKS